MMSEKMKIEVRYHKNCTDGFMSAYLLRHWFKSQEAELDGLDVLYTPVQYGDEALPTDAEEFWIIDYSYSKDDLAKIVNESPNLKCLAFLDHHKTAIDIYGASDVEKLKTINHLCLEQRPDLICCEKDVKFFTKLIQNRSGAGLALETIDAEDIEVPNRLRQGALAVEDRDLWLFKLDGTKIWNKVLNVEMTFEAWDKIFEMSEEEFSKVWIKAGLELDFYEAECKRLKGLITPVETKLGKTALMNCDMKYVSNVSDLVKDEYAFCAFFIISPARGLVIVSLRSSSDGDVDVSVIAKHNGGGGHKNASGFSFPISDTEKFLKLMNCDFLP
jgi:uncharacterized protein